MPIGEYTTPSFIEFARNEFNARIHNGWYPGRNEISEERMAELAEQSGVPVEDEAFDGDRGSPEAAERLLNFVCEVLA